MTGMRVEDVEGKRWCTCCNEYLPLERFYPGQVRYYCRRHVLERYQKTHRARMRATPEFAAFQRARVVAKQMFGLTAELTFKEFVALGGATVVPRDPAAALSPANAVAVQSRAQGEALARLWAASRNAEVYAHALRELAAVAAC